MKNHIILKLIIAFLILISIENVSALEENTYENKNGVILTEKEYKFVTSFYNDDYFNNMTQQEYDWISFLDINNKKVIINSYVDDNNAKGPVYSTGSKKITIAKTCDASKCAVLTNLTWLTNPIIRSYDVIGARFSGTSLYSNTFVTKVTSSAGVSYYNYNKVLSNGFGTSVLLPASPATNIIVDQQFYTNPGGSIYASYQHATSNISLSTSYNYNISASGYGGVFAFYGSATGVYDGMGGVNI